MYAKLALRNMKKSIKDYLIYFITLSLCVGLFYAFVSLSSEGYSQNMPATYRLDSLYGVVKYTTYFITGLLLFLIRYVNNYMMSRKKREFAIHTIMGMEQRTTALLFFCETFMMGILAILAGVVFGAALAQVITAIILESVGDTYHMYFSLYPDTVLITIVFFIGVFSIIGFLNTKTIRKMKIIDMLNDENKTEVDFKKNKGIRVALGIATVAALFMIGVNSNLYPTIYDSRYTLGEKIIFLGSFVMPAIFIGLNLLYISYEIILWKKKKVINIYLFETLMGILVLIELAISILALRMNLFLMPLSDEIVDISIKNFFMVLAIGFICMTIYGFYYVLGSLIIWVKDKFIKIKYKGENLFLLGQLTAKLKTASKTMALITITLMAAIVSLIFAPLLSGWALGYLKDRAVFDLEISSAYNEVYEPQNLPSWDYKHVVEYLKEEGYPVSDYAEIEFYFINEEDFYRREKTDFPVLAISLSDYNQLRCVAGLEAISLSEGSFTTQWYSTASLKEREDFLKANRTLFMREKTLELDKVQQYKAPLGTSIYNYYTDVIFILPDAICEGLTVANISFHGNLKEQINYKFAKRLGEHITDYYLKEMKRTGNSLSINQKLIQETGGISGALTIKLLLLYLGIVMSIICFTILSLQQLSDSMEHKKRFNTLRKLGVDEKSINRLILKQMTVWFGIPIVIAIIGGGTISYTIIDNSFKQFITYVGDKVLIFNIAVTMGGILIILMIYFVMTAILFKRNINHIKG